MVRSRLDSLIWLPVKASFPTSPPVSVPLSTLAEVTAFGASLPVLPEDEGNLVDEHHILDLHEVVRQRLLIGQPPHPLCADACQGLCPTCGKNLNDGGCDCAAEDADPRWAALRQLLR